MIIQEFKTDLSLYEIYDIFKDDHRETMLLNSSVTDENLGQYSFIGLNLFVKLQLCKNQVLINGEVQSKDFFNSLRKILNRYKVENETYLPFVCGGIGYLSYDFGQKCEEIESGMEEEVDIPSAMFNFYDNIIIFDHKNNKSFISSMEIMSKGTGSIDEILKKISESRHINKNNLSSGHIDIDEKFEQKGFHSNFCKKDYIEAIRKTKNYIREGHVYITNMTQRFVKETYKDGYTIFKELMAVSPAPFSAYLDFNDFKIISSSPERFLKIDNGKMQTRPIKGTRPRGCNFEEDMFNKEELKNSEKDKSELLMIVDLERNDLSKVCKKNSVKVTELFEIEEYSTVFHLISNVEGALDSEKDIVHGIEATFPGGSITGAPKIRAMEIIDELEHSKRNIYTGSLGYISFHDTCDLNIIIRSILLKDNKAYFGVGGGITYESEEEFEYEETLHKAKAIMKILE